MCKLKTIPFVFTEVDHSVDLFVFLESNTLIFHNIGSTLNDKQYTMEENMLNIHP